LQQDTSVFLHSNIKQERLASVIILAADVCEVVHNHSHKEVEHDVVRQDQHRQKEGGGSPLMPNTCMVRTPRIYIVYWNLYAVFNDYRQLRIPLPLTKRQMMLMALSEAFFFGPVKGLKKITTKLRKICPKGETKTENLNVWHCLLSAVLAIPWKDRNQSE